MLYDSSRSNHCPGGSVRESLIDNSNKVAHGCSDYRSSKRNLDIKPASPLLPDVRVSEGFSSAHDGRTYESDINPEITSVQSKDQTANDSSRKSFVCETKKRRTTGALLFNLRGLFEKGCFPTGMRRLPLELSNKRTSWISYRIKPPSDSTRVSNRVDVSMLLFVNETDTKPLYTVNLSHADMVANVCSESGRCIYLAADEGAFEFRCCQSGKYDYKFWEAQMRYMGVRIISPTNLFTVTGGHVLGTGSFAKVYNSIHRSTGRGVAIKRIPRNLVSSLPSGYMTAVQIEIDVLRRINHPFIVQFLAAFEDDYYYYVVLEKLYGGNLCDWLRANRKMPEVQCRIAITRVLLALLELKNQKIIHRDLKLENLVLEDAKDPSSVKLIDFGLATFLDMPRMSMYCGSPGYVAPEIIRQKPYNVNADVFSAGIVLYALLCGKTPFYVDSQKASQIMKKTLECDVVLDVKLWHGISTNAQDLVLRMLDKNPSTRITVEEALHHPWLTAKGVRRSSLPSSVGFSKDAIEKELVNMSDGKKQDEDSTEGNKHLRSQNDPINEEAPKFWSASKYSAITRLMLLSRNHDPSSDLKIKVQAYQNMARAVGPRLKELSTSCKQFVQPEATSEQAAESHQAATCCKLSDTYAIPVINHSGSSLDCSSRRTDGSVSTTATTVTGFTSLRKGKLRGLRTSVKRDTAVSKSALKLAGDFDAVA